MQEQRNKINEWQMSIIHRKLAQMNQRRYQLIAYPFSIQIIQQIENIFMDIKIYLKNITRNTINSFIKSYYKYPIVDMSSDLQSYTKISETFKQIVNNLTTKQLSITKLYFINLSKKIAAGDDKFLSEFKDLKSMLDSVKEAKGKLPIHYAVASGNVETVRYLIQEIKVDYQVKDKQGNTPFFTAVQHGSIPVIRYFVDELGVSPFSVKDGEIGTLHVAANQNNTELMDYLISKGCDIEKVSIYGKPINWAVGSRNVQATKYLLEKGADANGDTTCPAPSPIILAVDFECQEIYEALLNASKPANINVKDPQGYSLLHLAAQKGNLKLVKQLIEKGLQVNLEVQGKTPLALAFHSHKWEVVSHLRKFTKNASEIEAKLQKQKQEKESQQTAPVDKQKAESIKIEGNGFFVDKKFQLALEKYKQALAYDPQNDAINRNLAACYLHLNKFQAALLHCHKAKIVDPKNVKNLYRQAQAYIGLGNLVDAASSLWECAMLEPQNAYFRQQFQKYVELAKQDHKKKQQGQ